MTDRHTDIPALFESYRDALHRGDVAEAVETAIRVEEVDAELDSLLDDFADAVAADETVLARTILGQITDTYDVRNQDFQARTQRAIASVEEGALTETERERLIQFTRRAARADLTRASFLVQAVNFFEGDLDESSIVETTTQTKATEQEIDQSAESVDSVAEETSLGASPSLLGLQGPEKVVSDTSVVLTVTVANVGDALSDDLALTVSSEDGISEDRSTYDVGALDGDQRRQVEIALVGDDPGTHAVTVSLRNEESVIESMSHSIDVHENERSVREVIVDDSSGEIDASDVRTAISHWADDDPIPGTGGETVSTEALQSIITDWTEAHGETADE